MVAPLKGIKVVDLTTWAFVPSAGGLLSHWGAAVVKIENPTAPDPSRLLGGTLEPGGASRSFKNYNRGKRSIAIDLAADAGRDLLYGLVADADVFLTSYLPAVRQKLRFDVDDIRAVNSDIVYAKGTGMGPLGPEAERRGYDMAIWWARGSLADMAMEVSGAQQPTGMVGHGDTTAGMALAGGVCAGLVQRALTGVAPVIDGSLLGTAIWVNHQPIIAAKDPNAAAVAAGGVGPRPATLRAYRTRDGRWVSLVFVNDPDRDWVELCNDLGHPELVTDARFVTTAARAEHAEAAAQVLEEIFSAMTLDECKGALANTHGVWAPVQKAAELHDDPQVIANGFIRDVDYPTGPLAMTVPPVLFDEDGGDPQPAPDFGQHTDEILSELGLTSDEIARHRGAGIVA